MLRAPSTCSLDIFRGLYCQNFTYLHEIIKCWVDRLNKDLLFIYGTCLVGYSPMKTPEISGNSRCFREVLACLGSGRRHRKKVGNHCCNVAKKQDTPESGNANILNWTGLHHRHTPQTRLVFVSNRTCHWKHPINRTSLQLKELARAYSKFSSVLLFVTIFSYIVNFGSS